MDSDRGRELDILPPTSDGIVSDQITLPEGPVTLTVEATDPSGKVDSDSVELTISAPNSAPLCEITQPSNGEFSVGGSNVTFAGTMSDVDIDADLLAVTWTSDKDGELSSGMADTSGTYVFDTSTMSLNTHQITMTVTDEMGLQCTDTIQYSIGTPPTIILQQPYVNTLINEGDEQVFSASSPIRNKVAQNCRLYGNRTSTVRSLLDRQNPVVSHSSRVIHLSFGTHIITATVTDSMVYTLQSK